MTNLAGLIAPAAEIGRFARAKNIWFHLDCAQTFGWMKLDVAQLGCDSFSGSTHKWMMGPLGGGVLYVRPERQGQIDPLILSVNYYRSAKPDEVNGQNFELIGQRTDPMLPGLMVALNERDAIGADQIERIARANAASMRQKLQAKGIKVWAWAILRCGARALRWSSMTCRASTRISIRLIRSPARRRVSTTSPRSASRRMSTTPRKNSTAWRPWCRPDRSFRLIKSPGLPRRGFFQNPKFAGR